MLKTDPSSTICAETLADAPDLGKALQGESLATRYGPLEWIVTERPVAYAPAVAWMEARAAAIRDGEAPECVWLLEHPPLYTAGTSANPADLLDSRFPVFKTGRGGQYTYHGPGQRVAYVLLDLKRRQPDVRAYVCKLEDWLIRTLADFDVVGERRSGRVGIWVERQVSSGGRVREDKIAAVGVRVRRWVTYHGISLNVAPDLDHFAGIVPCGIREHGVTSLSDLGRPARLSDVDLVLKRRFLDVFG